MVHVDPRRVKPFDSEAAFEKWMAAPHDTEPEIWIKFHKKSSGLPSVTLAQALDVALRWGWIRPGPASSRRSSTSAEQRGPASRVAS